MELLVNRSARDDLDTFMETILAQRDACCEKKAWCSHGTRDI